MAIVDGVTRIRRSRHGACY